MLRAYGSREKYQELVDAAQANFVPMTTENWFNLFDAVDADIPTASDPKIVAIRVSIGRQPVARLTESLTAVVNDEDLLRFQPGGGVRPT